MSFLPPTESEVTNASTFAEWAHAKTGCAPANLTDIKILNKKAKTFFKAYQDADWQTLIQVVQWCQSKKRRMPRVWHYVDQYSYAFSAHAIDLTPQDQLKLAIDAALSLETDLFWRSRLRRAVGRYRVEVLRDWWAARGSTTKAKKAIKVLLERSINEEDTTTND